jgi:DNA mismatch repair protein MutS
VAQLAGLPRAVLARAREVLAELERERTAEHLAAGSGPGGASVARDAAEVSETPQLALFTPEHPLLDALRETNPDALTPLEALRRLAEWKERWG